MPKKHHKTHRHHRDKSSLKTRTHRKPKRDHHHANPNPTLEPIEEVSKERVKIDKNACGDYAGAALVRSQIDDEKVKRSKKSRDRNVSKTDKVDGEKKKKEASNKDYPKKVERPFEGKSVRHHSLEKNQDSLLDKTKFLFRKEKSFNDAVHKVSDFKHDTDHKALKDKEEKHRKHRSRKNRDNPQKPQPAHKTEREKKHRSKDKTSTDKKPTYGGVQEVIYCQMDHVPYKMRNDKNASEIKDLYRRVKKEDKGEQSLRNRSHSHGKEVFEHHVKSYQEKFFEQQLKEHKKNRERYKSSENPKHGEHKPKECPKKKDKHKNVSEIGLGPYEKYFAFEKPCHSEQCKRHHKSVDRKHQNLDQEHKRRKHSPDKHELRAEEEKIHQIVEGDLKTYFGKIQTMIDQKLDAILQVSNRRKRHEERSKSKPKESSADHKKRSQKENENLNTEKLINEILKRIRNDEQRLRTGPSKEHLMAKLKKSFSQLNYDGVEQVDSPKMKPSERNLIPHAGLVFPVKVMCSPAGRNSLESRAKRQSSSMKEETSVALPTASNSGSKIPKRKTQTQIYSASDERLCKRSHEDYRRSSSPGRVQQKPKRDTDQSRDIPPSKHDVSIQGPQSSLLQETFRCPTTFFYNAQIAPRRDLGEFIVQGIEPPILECTKSTTTPRKSPHVRKLECKTVSVVAIPPQPELRELSMINQTQTSIVGKSPKASMVERELVEKRKQSKRFKLYYQYSADDSNSAPPEVNMAFSSEAKSIVSDSYKVLSDASGEEQGVAIRGHRHRNRRCLNPEVYQLMPTNIPKKWNRISTPKDSHLNNIMEESSDLSISKQIQDYFVPLRGTRQYYCRVLSSSHSDYCFKIDKKPAISDLSLQSRDTWDGLYVFGDTSRNDRFDGRSKSEFRIHPKNSQRGQYMYKSKSDVCLLEAKTDKYYVKPKEPKESPKHGSALKSILKDNCKSCQTVEVKNEAVLTEDSEQKQFQDIYKTIDILEEGIQSSRVPPETTDAAVSSTFFGSEEISDKKPQFDAIYKTIDNLEDRVMQTTTGNAPVEKADAAVGSPARTKTSVATKQIHDVAVGSSEAEMKSPRSKSENPPAKVYRRQRKSTAVSPIRITQETVTQVSPEPPAKRTFTPRPPRPKPFGVRQPKQKEATPRVDTKKAQSRSITPRAPIVLKKEPPPKPAAARAPTKPIEVSPKPLQCVKVFRSEERSHSVPRNDATSPISVSGSNRASRRKESKPVINGDSAAQQKKSPPKAPNRPACDSCFLHYPSVNNTPAGKSRISHLAASAKPFVVNTATFRRQPPVQTKIIEIDVSSTSSSVGDSLMMAQNVRRSRSLVELGSRKSRLMMSNSRSDVCCLHQTLYVKKTEGLFTEEGSSVSNNMEKFTNKPNLRCTAGSKSHGTSLDHYIGSKFTSRLLLTKDYKGAELSAYQKRKLYDQSIRQRMKRKFKFSKVDVGPQIFEVRFLSMVNPERETDRVVRTLRGSKLGAVVDEGALKVKERNLIFNESNGNIENDTSKESRADQEKLLSFCEKFFNMNSGSMDTSEVLKNTSCACNKFSKSCPACRNFLSVVETLYSSLTQDRETNSSSNQASPEMIDLEADTPPKVEKIYSATFNKNSSDSNQSASSPSHLMNFINPTTEFSNFKAKDEPDYPLLSQPMSCPILATNSSSFEFLYEDSSSSGRGAASRETVIANLTRPFDQQNFHFNTSQYNVETPFIRAGNYESPARSVESGYASVNSKSRGANSLTNFFKKPYIAALFKPPPSALTKRRSDLCRAVSEIGPGKPSVYKEMARNCQLYARKVRESSESKLGKSVGDYEEFSLKCLLGDPDSDSQIVNVPSEESVNGSVGQAAERDDECCEATVIVEAPDYEIASKPSQSSYYENGCKLVLSNDCLKVDSITYLGPEFFVERTESSRELISDDCDDKKSSSDTHNFFTSLIRTYEKELEICQKLYNDDSFNRTLLAAIEESQAGGRKKKKKAKFFRFFTKRPSERPTAKVEGQIIEFEAEMNLEKKASTKLQTLASNAKKCFSMLADAVKLNENINNEIKICGLLRLLERIESGDFFMMQNDDRTSVEENIRSQVTSAFIKVHELCQREAKKYKKRITNNELELIKSFVIKHRISLLSKTDIVASYIARGIIRTEEQLKAAITFLIRCQPHREVDTTAFEKFCKFTK